MQLADLLKSCGLAALAAAMAVPLVPATAVAAADNAANAESSADQQRGRGDRARGEGRRGNRAGSEPAGDLSDAATNAPTAHRASGRPWLNRALAPLKRAG